MELVVGELLAQPETGDNPSAPVTQDEPASAAVPVAQDGTTSAAVPLARRHWRRGGVLTLADVAKLVGKARLGRLKSECGGLKTLLKRHWQTFDGTCYNLPCAQ